MLIDLHVHTTAYSACARSSPYEMMERATEIGLEGIVLTEHHMVWPEAEIAALQRRFPAVKLFRGVELTTQENNDMLVYDVAELDWFEAGMPGGRIVAQAHRRGGAVTWAHPFRWKLGTPDDLRECPPDAMELMSCNMLSYLDEGLERARQELGVWGIASSDAHHWTQLGCFAARFHQAITNERELAAAIRSGAFALVADESLIQSLDHPHWPSALPHVRRSVSLSLAVVP